MITLSLRDAQHNMQKIIDILSTGGVIISPSDTTYGILADATNEMAVKRLIALKERPLGKAISVFVSDFNMMGEYVDMQKITPEVKSLLPGSYTLVLPSIHQTSQLLEAEDGTLGVRLIGSVVRRVIARETGIKTQKIADERKQKTNEKLISIPDFVTTLVSTYGKPLTATSANISGKGLCYSPYAFLHQISQKKKELVDLIIDAEELPHNPPSTIIHLAGHEPRLIRANERGFLHHMAWYTKKESELTAIAEHVFSVGKPYFGKRPVVILLDGELGGGKTTWTKYFARILGIEHIVSPTYTYECEYPVSEVTPIEKLKHYDLYNIVHRKDIEYLNIAGNLTPNTIACIEWPGQLNEEEKMTMLQHSYVVKLLFEYMSEGERKVQVWWN